VSAATTERGAALDFEAFTSLLHDELGCDVAGRGPDAQLVDDLGWDSLAFFELLGLFDRFDLDAPDELVGALRTLGDVHHYFVELSARSAGSDAPRRGGPTLHLPTQRDFEYLFDLHVRGDHLVRYRLRAVTPSPDSFHRLLWEGVTAQFVVRSGSGDPVGLVSCFGADFRNRHAHIGVLGDPAWRNSGLIVAGAWQFITYLFEQFDLRKLYAEVLASNLVHLLTGVDRLFEVQGKLMDHEFLDGRYQDLYVLALDRDRWQAQERRRTWSGD
jgi:acyl carrier protein